MTAKIVSIRTRAGDDLTPRLKFQSAQPISQRQAIRSTVWPVVQARMSDISLNTVSNSNRSEWARAILLVVAAAALSCAIIGWSL